MKNKINIVIAFENDQDLLEKDNFFVIDNADVITESTGRGFGVKPDKSIKPNSSVFNKYKDEIIFAFTENEIDKIQYNLAYKCYFMVSLNLNGDKLKNKFIDLLIIESDEKIKEYCIKTYHEQENLRTLFDMKG